MSSSDSWLLLISGLLLLVLAYAAVKARRLARMPLRFPAFACFCGGVLIALLERLKRNNALDEPLRKLTAVLSAGVHTAGVLLALQLLAAVLLVYILFRWLRGAASGPLPGP